MLRINSDTIEGEMVADMSALQLGPAAAIDNEEKWAENGDGNNDLLAWLYDYASRT